MDVGIDQAGHDNEVSEILIGGAISDLDDHTALEADSGRAHPIRQDDTPAAQGRHRPNLIDPSLPAPRDVSLACSQRAYKEC